MIIRWSKAENGETRVPKGCGFGRISWNIKEIWDVKIGAFDPDDFH